MGTRRSRKEWAELWARPTIDRFEAVRDREGWQRGFFVAFDYSADTEHECAAFLTRTGRPIKRIAVQMIVDAQHVQKMWR